MIRRIITIDEEKCNGCGLCAEACHEGAIDIVDGKAKLMRENFCDGFGDCLPNCPTGAITFEEREAPAYDEAAVASPWFNDRPYVDTLNKKAIERFAEFTHEKYYVLLYDYNVIQELNTKYEAEYGDSAEYVK